MPFLGRKGKINGTWDEDSITTQTKSGHLIGKALPVGGLYHIIAPPTFQPTFAAPVDFDSMAWQWQRGKG
jgi:hypothetical protein